MFRKFLPHSSSSLTPKPFGMSFAIKSGCYRLFSTCSKPHQFLEIKVQPQSFARRLPKHEGSHQLGVTEFTDEPRGYFKGQKDYFVEKGIKQLGLEKEVLVFRGDPRPSNWLLENGIRPISPLAGLDVRFHRNLSSCSGGISFTTSFGVACYFGALSSRKLFYGDQPTIGKGGFNVLLTRLKGQKYNVAGPFKAGEHLEEEREVTVAGAVSSSDILGFRRCESAKSDTIVSCFSIFVRPDLCKDEKDKVIDSLSGKNNELEIPYSTPVKTGWI